MATKKLAFVDSINLKGDALTLFQSHKDFIVTPLLSDTHKDVYGFYNLVGRYPNRNIKEAFRVTHFESKTSFLMVSYSNSYSEYTLDNGDRGRIYDYTIHFAGLKSYTSKGENLLEVLISLTDNLIYYLISRIDIATDSKIRPSRLLSKLDADTNRSKTTFKNTTYWNQRSRSVTVAYYDKGLKANLPFKLHRVEYRFSGQYLNNNFHFSNDGIKALYKRLETYIYKAFNESIKIQNPFF